MGVNVYINSPGQENLVTCFQGPGLVTLQGGATYYLMFADTDMDAINGGALSVSLDAPPPPMELDFTLAPTGTVDRFGTVTIHGTITCSEQATFADLSAFLRQACRPVRLHRQWIRHGRLWADAIQLDAMPRRRTANSAVARSRRNQGVCLLADVVCRRGTAGTVRLGR